MLIIVIIVCTVCIINSNKKNSEYITDEIITYMKLNNVNINDIGKIYSTVQEIENKL